MDAARDGRGRPFPYAKHRKYSSALKSPPQNQTPSFTLMTRSLTPEVLLLVLREPSPYQRHTSPQFVRPRPAVSQNVIPAVARVTFLTRGSSFILHPSASHCTKAPSFHFFSPSFLPNAPSSDHGYTPIGTLGTLHSPYLPFPRERRFLKLKTHSSHQRCLFLYT